MRCHKQRAGALFIAGAVKRPHLRHGITYYVQ